MMILQSVAKSMGPGGFGPTATSADTAAAGQSPHRSEQTASKRPEAAAGDNS